jgi:ATP-dependent helicase/nuclease subunit A
MNFTPDQQRAISSYDRNVIVVAGAGSGKTAVLVQRYLALLDAHPEWPLNALVAITFTEKAAGEMRDRVRQALERRLANASSDDERRLWASRVSAMDSARIDTFHSLCADILRANAAEARIDPGFAVLDDIDARILLDNVIDDALRLLVSDGDAAVRLFSEYEMDTVRATVMRFISVPIPALDGDLFANWQAAWEQDARAALDAFLRGPAAYAADWLPLEGWPAAGDKLGDIWQATREALARLASVTALDAALPELTVLSDIKVNVGAAAAWGGKEAVSAAKEPLKLLRDAARDILDLLATPPNTLDRRAGELVPMWAALIGRVQRLYADKKTAIAALDFDDLEARARHLLLNDAEVRARYAGAEFKHVLVDEFQDTNAAQWDIVRALADPAIPGSLFLVGDARQSIYAFRGADVSVFERVRAQLRQIGGEASEIPLAQSFRTHRGLVDCFNALFVHILVRDPHSPVRDYQIELGQPMAAFREEAPCGDAAVELLLIEKKSRDEDSDSASRRQQEGALLAQRIREMVEAGRPIYDKRAGTHRPMGYGDVALLFQSSASLTVYEDALKQAGLPFVTVAGRGYYDRQEVWDLVNLLNVLYNTSDDLALAAVLRSPLFSLSDDALLAMRMGGDRRNRPPLWLALADAGAGILPYLADDDRARAEFAANCLGELADLAGRITIAELLRMALDETGYLATLTGLPDGARRRGNVEKLLDKATSSGKITLGAFSQYLDDLSQNEAREGEALLDVEGAITLMTVHRSKGLEFPLVALVDTSWRRNDRADSPLVLDPVYGLACTAFDPDEDKLAQPYAFRRANALRQAREEAERKRLLYVAATRAQDTLLISGQVTRRKDGKVSADGWLDWLLEAFGLEEFEVGEDVSLPYSWGHLRLRVVPAEQDDSAYREPLDTSAWNDPAPPTNAAPPPLLAEPDIARDAPVRSLTATQVADLGAIDLPGEGVFYKRRLRRSLFYDAPAHIEQVVAPGQWVSNARIGEIVHKALRWWRFPTETDDMEAVLQGYAWEAGVTEKAPLAVAVQTARRLLKRMQLSPLYEWLNEAQAVYREVPFVYDSGAHTVHGVVDVVFQRADGSWAVLDYKTVDVPRADTEGAVEAHAERYDLRLGVYAAATREQLRRMLNVDVIPDVLLYYINHGTLVTVPAERWQAALDDFDTQVGKLFGQGR